MAKQGKQTRRKTRATLGPTTIRTPIRYGWKPDLPDHRDFTYAAPAEFAKKNLGSSVDLRRVWRAPCYDQGNLGSCTGNAIAGAIEFALAKKKTDVFTPSRLFIYYNERVIEGTVDSDAGAQIRDGMKSVAGVGFAGKEAVPLPSVPPIPSGRTTSASLKTSRQRPVTNARRTTKLTATIRSRRIWPT
jgi:C1A family cysteine protease